MKNMIVFAAQECCSGMSEVSLLNSLLTVENTAADAEAVARVAIENGYDVYLYYLHNNAHKASKRNIGNHLVNCKLVTDKNLAETLLKCEVAVLLGIPAMQGTIDSVADRNYGNMWFDYSLNGESMGQIGMIKTLLSVYGIPVIAVMSDVAAINESKKIFGEIPTVVSVYDSYICAGGWQCWSTYPVEEVHEKLEAAINVALKQEHIKPVAPKFPMTARVHYMRTDFCDVACAMNPDIERLDARTVEWKINDVKTITDMSLKGEE